MSILCIFVAGKNSKTQSEKLSQLLAELNWPDLPITELAKMSPEEINKLLIKIKAGQYKRLTKCLFELSRANFNLNTCTCEDLEEIHGISFKTSRFFVVYSREDTDYAILDVHILNWLRGFHPEAPKSTPSTKRAYNAWEQLFLTHCVLNKMKPHELDIEIWRQRQKSWQQ